MTNPVIHPHKPVNSDTWQIVESGGSSVARVFRVLEDGFQSAEAAWARILTNCIDADEDVYRAALERLAEYEDWRGECARLVLQGMEEV